MDPLWSAWENVLKTVDSILRSQLRFALRWNLDSAGSAVKKGFKESQEIARDLISESITFYRIRR